MSTITTIQSTDNGSTSRTEINTNFANLNADKLQTADVVAMIKTTADIWIDVNRTDSYTPNGTILQPYKSISTAITAMNASSLTQFVVRLSPGTYTEASSVTFPSKPVVIYGNGSTFVAVSGVTFPSAFDCYDLTIVGNVIQSDTSLTSIHNFQSGYIQGSLTVSGLCALAGMATDTSGVITINSSAQLAVSSSSIGSRIVNSGTLYFNGSSLVRNDNSHYCIDSSAGGSVVYMSGDKIVNQGTGGGINCGNGATSTPNEMSNIDVVVNNTVNAITCGTARTYLTTYTAFTLGGVAILPTGTNFLTALNGGGVIASGLSSTTTIVNVGNSVAPVSGQILTATSGTAATWQNAPSSSNTSVNQVGGALILDGTNTYATYMSKASSVYTLVSDLPCGSLTVNNGVTLNTAGYKILCASISNAGTIQNNGGAGTNGSGATHGNGGTAAPGVTLPAGAVGANGGDGGASADGSAGVNGTTITYGIGVAGVAGVTGGTGVHNPGAGGTIGAITNTRLVLSPVDAFGLFDFRSGSFTAWLSSGGSGGSGGGSGGSSSNGGGGGGSGGSGGVVYIQSPSITNTGTIQANGGNGGNGGNASNAGNGGGAGAGGSGGSGGAVILIYTTLSNSGTIQAIGGTHGTAGTGNGTTPAGNDGGTGIVIQIH